MRVIERDDPLRVAITVVLEEVQVWPAVSVGYPRCGEHRDPKSWPGSSIFAALGARLKISEPVRLKIIFLPSRHGSHQCRLGQVSAGPTTQAGSAGRPE